MAEIEVSAKPKGAEESVVISFDFGDDVNSMIEMFGAEVVFSSARAHMKVGLQSAMRKYYTLGKDVSLLTSTWKPGMVMERVAKDPIAEFKAAFATWDEAKKAEFLEGLGV